MPVRLMSSPSGAKTLVTVATSAAIPSNLRRRRRERQEMEADQEEQEDLAADTAIITAARTVVA